MTEKADEQHYVRVGDRYYKIEAFDAAFHTAVLERLETVIPKKATARSMFRAVRGMRTKTAHRAVLRRALKLLLESDQAVDPPDPKVVIGEFPPALTI